MAPLIINYLQGNLGQGGAYPVGVGFIPILASAGYLHQFLLVVGRTGINPVPTADTCNTLAINGLSK